MSIALDAMGGDHAPGEIVAGALEALPFLHEPLILVGQPEKIEPLIPAELRSKLEVVAASEVVGMDEKPLDAYRKKKDNSLRVAANLVHEGRAKVMVSAGNTGAASATALLTWRQIPGIHRPAIANFIPNHADGFCLIDAGASPDVDPEHLVEFAVMGRAYCQKVLGRANPKVHLLNIGEEPGKGNAFAKQAYHLLEQHPWFAGNIEGKDLFLASPDVVVCDAFVGNIMLKTGEGVAEMMLGAIKKEIPTNKLAKLMYWPVRKVLNPLRKKMDYAEYGGSPLLGLNGLCIISHGRSNARAIKNALFLAERAIDHQLVETIRAYVDEELPADPPKGGKPTEEHA